MTYARYFVLTGLLLGMGARAQDVPDRIFSQYGRIRTSETITHAEDGSPTGMQTVQTSVVALKRKVVENHSLDRFNVLRPVSRITETEHTDGGKTTVEETATGPQSELTVTRVTTLTRQPDGSTVTTVETPDDNGNLRISQRTTAFTAAGGTKTTIVETLNSQGRLAVSRTTTER